MATPKGIKVLAQNRKALHDYQILETVEAGLALTGTEIKAIRAGKLNIQEAYARPQDGELWLLGAHIASYEAGNRYNQPATRPRKLLLHRRQINALASQAEARGLTLVPLRIYLKGGLAKVDLALARGKKTYDKRQALAQRDAERQMRRALKR